MLRTAYTAKEIKTLVPDLDVSDGAIDLVRQVLKLAGKCHELLPTYTVDIYARLLMDDALALVEKRWDDIKLLAFPDEVEAVKAAQGV